MPNPLVSVIIPVYDREYCVKRAIDSVLAQSFKDFEVVVVDDGSQDGSVEILKSYGDAIHLICQKNAGVGSARNAAIRAARGRWIAFLDSDDEWRPDKLECQMQLVEKYKARVCYSRCISEEGKPLPDLEDVAHTLKEPGVYHVTDPVEFLSRARCHPYLQSMVLDRQLFDQAGFFDQTMFTGEDTLWLFKLSLLCDCIYVDRPLTIIHRYTDNSLTYDARPEKATRRFDGFVRAQAEMYWRLREARPEQAGLTRGRLAYSLGCRAELACAAGEFKLARERAWEGMTFAGDFRTFARCAVLWLAPWLCQGHFRKKWHRKK
jgi:glycosyltransferase involved in cell wall biosynthesis